MRIAIYVIVDEADEYADPDHPMGVTNDAYERLTGYPAPLSWLGEVEDIEKVD